MMLTARISDIKTGLTKLLKKISLLYQDRVKLLKIIRLADELRWMSARSGRQQSVVREYDVLRATVEREPGVPDKKEQDYEE